ncbi:Piwi-like protein 1 [Halotydeus destructor]|nr:Piwi-like protein 1 [Halotydeus destructor]
MSEEGTGAGRARGRARGRPPTGSEEDPRLSPSAESGAGDGGNGGAVRGRGGYRPLKTIPTGVTATTGSGGVNCRLYSNYFRLKTPENLIVQQYQVDFAPEVESTRLRRALLYDNKALFNDAFLFDGMHDIKSTTRLPEPLTDVVAVRKTDQVEIKITIKHVGEVQWGSFEMLRLYNTQVRRNLNHMKYLLVGRHFFDPKMRHDIPQYKLQVWQGVLTAVNNHDGGILMVCDTVHKVIRADTVRDVLREVFGRGRDTFQDNARRELAGSIVMTSYNNRTYKIDDLCFDKNPTFEFDRKGVNTTIADYYKSQYNITIQDLKQPLIQCLPSAREQRAGDNKPLLLVPELCVMTGLTESLKINFDLKKQMTQMTQAPPPRRVGNLTKFMQTMNANPNVKEDMTKWNLKFDDSLVEVTGRIIAGEKIYMQGDTEQTACSFQQRSGDFSKEIRSKKMRVAPKPLKKWAVLVSGRDNQLVADFTQTLNRVCGPLGIQMDRPMIKVLDNDRTGTYVDACKNAPKDAQIIVIIVPNNNKERYDTIKKIFCCDQPVPSQVIVGKTLSKKQMLMSVCTKIGIQMGAKLGGEPWTLVIPPKDLMVVGYDTHHDGTRRGASVGGFVCSLNPSLSRFYSRVAYHTNHEEMSNNFAQNFAEGLKRYHEVNGKLPLRIVVYRDGVSDGQIPHVYDYEMTQIKEAIRRIAGQEDIKLSFVIVTKRVNARFFERTSPTDTGNPSPGTVVDTDVTRLERYDFYLVSQSVRQGTVAPTSYNIIEDETNWKATHHQQLAYKLCHLYYNWMGTIRVPAPCQYAHKLAFLTGTALHKEPSTLLADTLYYL